MNTILDPRSVREAHAAGKVRLLDVRTPAEHGEVHIEGSTLMPLDRLDPAQVAGPVVLVCRSGKRAEQAHQKLHAAGCENLVILDGGVMAWESAGLPLERTQRKVLPLMRQVQLIIGVLALTGSILALTVHKNFAILPAFLGAGLTMAGSTGWCGLAILLSKMPWNKVQCAGGNVKSCSI